MNVKQLKALEVDVEQGRIGQFRNLDSEFGHNNGINAKRAYKGSLDAAKALHDAVLPGWVVANIGQDCAENQRRWTVWITSPNYLDDFTSQTASEGNPARAWLLAIIRALIAQAEVAG